MLVCMVRNEANSNAKFFDLFLFGIFQFLILFINSANVFDDRSALSFATQMATHKLFRFFGRCSRFGFLRQTEHFSGYHFIAIKRQDDDDDVHDVGWHAHQTEVLEHEIQQVCQIQRQPIRYQYKKHLDSGGRYILEKSCKNETINKRNLFDVGCGVILTRKRNNNNDNL